MARIKKHRREGILDDPRPHTIDAALVKLLNLAVQAQQVALRNLSLLFVKMSCRTDSVEEAARTKAGLDTFI